MINPLLVPGALVRHPGRPDWGQGQVQSVDGNRVTVNFTEAGKQTMDAGQVGLVVESGDPETGRAGPDAY